MNRGPQSSFAQGEDDQRSRLTSRVLVPGGTGGKSSISFGDADGHGRIPSSSRVLQPGGTGGKSSIAFGASDDEPPRPRSRGGAAGTGGRSHIAFGDGGDNDTSNAPLASRVLQPGGTGGRSNIAFGEEDIHQHVNAPVASRVLHPGGTGGRSNISLGHDPSEGALDSSGTTHVRRQGEKTNLTVGEDPSIPHAEPNSPKLSSRVLQPGGSGGRSQLSFDEEHVDGATSAMRVARPGASGSSSILLGGDPDDNQRTRATSSRVLHPGGTGGDSSITFGDDGGSTASHSHPRNGRRLGDAPYNASSITLGDDGGDIETSSKGRLSSRVLQPGGMGGKSNVTFGDDGSSVDRAAAACFFLAISGVSRMSVSHDNASKKTTTSSRVLQPGGMGGKSSITFMDDRTAAGLDVAEDDFGRPRPLNASIAGRGAVRNPNVSQVCIGNNANDPQEQSPRRTPSPPHLTPSPPPQDDRHSGRGAVRNPNVSQWGGEKTDAAPKRNPVFKPQAPPGGASSISFF
ncbi:hypothetical protein THASP1DRAFT_24108 [Thamnocephalis sphaerospora]|uniref:Uncharacterized protein n=1 Tax=Thamnocephalis sphaerospora TaxID=78915 RepID=A0A4P9XPJ0_9FUNG|nr:hypothetical protein THASP1DRAFT_24108 [Thamnocephalis sphaerospora]|eukprot:RKP07792.1 hypothetical protein THASP1DRAFT_24108 [Thamnocephalis sphaerospora]